MKNPKLKILGFSSITIVILAEVFHAAVNLTGHDYYSAAFVPVRALCLLAVDAFIFFILMYFTSRIINDRDVPSELRNKKLQAGFLVAGTVMSAADAVRDAIIDPSNINSSIAVISVFALWLGVCSIKSLGEVSDGKRTNRLIRALLCFALSAVTLFLYILFWISAFYKF